MTQLYATNTTTAAVPAKVADKLETAVVTLTTVTASVVAVTAMTTTVATAGISAAGSTIMAASSAVVAKPGLAQGLAVTKALQTGSIGTASVGPDMLYVLEQLQGIAATGGFAPIYMHGLRTVSGSLDWSVQVPVPFWDAMSKSSPR